MEMNQVRTEKINNAINDENIDAIENKMKNFDPFRIHEGVTCGVCKGQIKGFRYKCAVCPSYDLCSKCEEAGYHPHHMFVQMMNEKPDFFDELVELVIKFEETIELRSDTPRPEHENGNISMIKCSECPDGIIKDFRYACLQCKNHNMCKSCRTRGLHPLHHILRISQPEMYDSNILQLLVNFLYIAHMICRGPDFSSCLPSDNKLKEKKSVQDKE